METIEILKNKVAQTEKEVLILSKRVDDEYRQAQHYRVELSILKDKDFEVVKEEVRDKLAGFRKHYYEHTLFSGLYERYMLIFIELVDMLCLAEPETKLTEELEVSIKEFRTRTESPVTIDLSSEIISFKDVTGYNLALNTFVNDADTDEKLKKALESPFFDKKNNL